MFSRNKRFREFLASWTRSQGSNLAVKTQVGDLVTLQIPPSYS
jgi:hypothetical protein